MIAYMMDCERVIREECERGATQKSVALSYAFAIRADAAGIEKQDWPKLHAPIRARWGDKGVERVKRKAWAIVNGQVQP